MAAPYTHITLTDIEDQAPKFGLEAFQEARFAFAAVEAEDTGFSLLRVKPGQRPPFAHRHENAEEVYVVIAGSGRI